MPSTCPDCGAVLPPGETCQDRFTAAQLKEIEQQEYYAVHHLSVACYMLQHNIYSRDGWLAARELLTEFIYHGLSPADARRQNNALLDNRRRSWSLTRGPKLAGVEHIQWSHSIADVRLDTPEHYTADVQRWAESVLIDSRALVGAAQHAAHTPDDLRDSPPPQPQGTKRKR